MFTSFRKYLLILFAVLFCLPVFSQSSQEPFGKNRIQYKNFEWKFITTSNFEIYYYGNSTDLAVKTATYAEDDFQRICELIGYTPSEKVKIILYNSVTDKQQSNIGLADQEIMIGGQTVLVKAKIEVAFKGSQIQLMKDISYGISYTIINTVMYGGNLKDVVKSSYLMNLPDWFINGAAAYISEDWSQEMDNFMRDRIIHHKIKNPTSYTGEEAKFIGQSIWNYIGKEYGDNNLSSIISLTRAFRNERESIESNLGVDFHEFIKKWESYYKNMNLPIAGNYGSFSDSSKLFTSKKNTKIYSLSMNKAGTHIAYVQNYNGKYKVKLHNTLTGKRKTIAKGGYKRTDQSVDYMLPVTAWQSDFSLSVILKKRDNLFLRNYNLKNKKRAKRAFDDYRQIYSFSYSQDGNQMVMSADKTGQTDIFHYNLAANSSSQITNDASDDIEPVFNSDNSIIFSSNRHNDTLSKNKDLPLYTDSYNLFSYSPSNKTILKKLTTSGNNFLPQIAPDKSLYFLSDEKGIVNISKLNSDYSSSTQVTNQPVDISNYVFPSDMSSLCFISLRKGKESIYLKKGPWNNSNYNSTPATERKGLVQSYNQTNTGSSSDSVNFNFNSNEETDFDKLVFESETKKDTTTILKNTAPYMPAVNTLRYTGPKKYQNPFSADKVISTLMVDPIRGLGALLEGGMSDLLGNHRIDAGGFIAFDFRSSKLFCEYRYIKKRVDFKVRYSRQTLNPSNNFASHRYILNTFGVTASYPFSVYHRISVTPFFTSTTFRENYNSSIPGFNYLARKDEIGTYEAIRGEYVYDNTLVTGINMLKGTRLKLSAEYYASNQNRKKDFGLLFLDFRKYIPIHKELVFATRISCGQYFGNSPKNFLIGGMDNWLLSNRDFYSNANAATQNPLTIDPGVNNSDILFVRYVTSLRGFKYNSQFGPKYLLFNGELRLPVVQYFYRGTIGSNFLRNLQLIGFTDIGTAYSGKITSQSDKNVKTVSVYPFSATVTNYLNPFLIGFGGGIRTMFLGYYIKSDLGWGLQNGLLSKPQLYLTFGYDF
jgi:Tol biopolymer transport system component